MGRKIILPHAGGLGDNLLYSTLPKMLTMQGHEVYYSTRMPFRNPEVEDLIVGRNSCVIGLSDEEPNAGAAMFAGTHKLIKAVKQMGNPILGMEALHGIYHGMNRTPSIGYNSRWRREWANKIVADPSSISQHFAAPVFEEFVAWVLRWYFPDVTREDVVVLTSQHAGPGGEGTLPQNERYTVANIYEYADILYSARAVLMTESGGHALASAVRNATNERDIFSLCTTMHFNDRIFVYPNVEYMVTGRLSPDFHPGYN